MSRKPGGFHTPFKDLRPAKAAPPSAAPRAKAPTPRRKAPGADEDQRVFEQAMRGVQPLSVRERQRAAIVEPLAPRRPDGGARARLEEAHADAELADLIESDSPLEVEEVGESVVGLARGIDRRLVKRLRAGHYPIDGELDLHEHTVAAAEAELERFLQKARADGKRCLLVIHGRGLRSGSEGPVLRPAVWRSLSEGRQRRHLLAFTSAPPAHGGTGAVLVLLRRRA
jgi:DNA-nicking Smr family endonuclease